MLYLHHGDCQRSQEAQDLNIWGSMPPYPICQSLLFPFSKILSSAHPLHTAFSSPSLFSHPGNRRRGKGVHREEHLSPTCCNSFICPHGWACPGDGAVTDSSWKQLNIIIMNQNALFCYWRSVEIGHLFQVIHSNRIFFYCYVPTPSFIYYCL